MLDGTASVGREPEVGLDETVDVADRPLLALRALAVEADRQQGAERIGGEQRAVAAAGQVVAAAPVDALPAGREADEDVAGVRVGERRPEAGEGVRVVVADEAALVDPGPQRGRVAVELPAGAAAVADLLAGPEAELDAAAADRRPAPPLVALGGDPGEQVDALDVVLEVGGDLGAEPGPLVGIGGQQPDPGAAAARADGELIGRIELGVRLQDPPALAEQSPGG